jgi:hypothetical protein
MEMIIVYRINTANCIQRKRDTTRNCTAYVVRVLTTPNVVQTDRIIQWQIQHPCKPTLRWLKPLVTLIRRTIERVRATDTAMDDKMHCQQTGRTHSYKDESCSASNNYFLYNHRLAFSSNSPPSAFRSTFFTNENEVLCLLPRIGELRGQLSRRL